MMASRYFLLDSQNLIDLFSGDSKPVLRWYGSGGEPQENVGVRNQLEPG